MTLVMPEGTPTLGNTKVKAVLTFVDAAAPKLATEINAVTSEDLSLHIYPAGWGPGADTPLGTAPARLGSKKVRQQFNRTTYSMVALQYCYDPQGADSDPGNEAKAILTEGTQIHLLERIGLDAETVPFAVGDRTRDHFIEVGPQVPSGDRTDENGEFYIMQVVRYVLGAGPTDGVVVA